MRTLRTSIKSIRATKITLFMRTLFACLLMTLLGTTAVPTWAGDAEADAKQALAEWKAAVAGVGEAKKTAKDAEEALGRATELVKSGGVTESEEKVLENLRRKKAEADAALEAAMERLFAAREALENALNALPDSDLKKGLIRQRDGLILDDPNARGESRKGKNPSLQTQQIVQTQTSGGLHVATFNTANGRVIVRLPDDISAGDTISGTVITEPKGQTPEERAKNQSVLVVLDIEIDGKRVEPFAGSPEKERETVIQQTFWTFTTTLSGRGGTVPIVVNGPYVGTALAPTVLARPTVEPLLVKPSGAVITPDPKITQPTFTFPPVGQTGRRIVVTGPFDGNAANTGLRIGDGEDGDNMDELDLIAESPRKAIFAAPTNVIGPTRLHLTEGNTRTTGNYRSVGVSLSAPKTSLLKGERTTLTVEVNGLEGIKNDVPLQLDATGVILMDGGNFQNLRIKPPEVNRDGKYFVNRAITGQQAGAFTVVATVIVSRFDVCIADDANRHSGILWNTFTGDYVFVNPFPPPRSGGQPPSGGTSAPSGNPPIPPGGTSLTGTGKPIMKGCIITLTHNAPDRRVFAKLDACTKTGEASVETTTPKSSVTIIDKNVSDTSCGTQ